MNAPKKPAFDWNYVILPLPGFIALIVAITKLIKQHRNQEDLSQTTLFAIVFALLALWPIIGLYFGKRSSRDIKKDE